MKQFNAARQEIYNPIETGVNALALTSARTSNGIGCAGFNQLSLEFDVAFGAATALTFFIEVSDLKGSTWRRIQADSVAAGVATLSDLQFSKTTGAATNFAVNIPINAENVRVRSITGVGVPTASDTVTMKAILGVV